MRREATSHAAATPGARALARLILASAALLLLLLAPAVPAPAATLTNERPLLFSFDGHDATAGAFTYPANLAVDYSCAEHVPPLDETTTPKCSEYDPANGAVYVLNRAGEYNPPTETAKRAIDKFHPEGSAWDFSALGKSSLDGSATPNRYFKNLYLCAGCNLANDLAVDTSPAHPGRIYVGEENGPVHAFDPSGAYLWSFEAPGGSCGVTVDAAGHLWTLNCSSTEPKALEFDTTGAGEPSETPMPGSFSLRTGSGALHAWAAIDQTGNDFYVGRGSGPEKCPERYVAEVFERCLSAERANEIALDQSSATGHVFTVRYTRFREFDSTGAEVPGSPFGRDLIGLDKGDFHGGDGIASDPATGRVYIADLASNTVKAFGPLTSGPAPDVSASEATDPTKDSATLHGTLNPQGLPSSYHFEVKPVVDEEQSLFLSNAESGSFRLVYKGTANDPLPEAEWQHTAPIPYDREGAVKAGECKPLEARPTAKELEDALGALPGIGAGNVSVSGQRDCNPGFKPGTEELGGGSYSITFEGALEATDIEQIALESSELRAGSWLEGTRTQGIGNWGGVRSLGPAGCTATPPLAADSADHSISCPVGELEGNTRYQFRLVGTDTENHLNSYSAPRAFATLAAEQPEVSNLEVPEAEITTSSAHIKATVDSKEAKTTWRALLSPQPAATTQAECEELPEHIFFPHSWELAAEGEIHAGETAPVQIEADLTGLLHAQSYCLRLIAANANPEPGVDDALFRTLPVAPSQVATAFAAPRTTTSARLNGRADPEGEVLTYGFQYSADGGEHWLPVEGRCTNSGGEPATECEDTSEARQQIVVGQELTGLEPGHTYSYRFWAENPADAGHPVEGAVETFTTRTAAEVAAVEPPSCPNEALRANQRTSYLPECRGVELVSSPDKGDQNVKATYLGEGASPPMTEDGEKVLWSVEGGAPGAYNGTHAAFLARRGAEGWSSQSLAPPPDRQIGGGDFQYSPFAATPDFSRFVFEASAKDLFTYGPSALVRLDENQNQEVLARFGLEKEQHYGPGATAGLTEDGSHVVTTDPHYKDESPSQLIDVGSGAREVLSIMPDGTPSACGLGETTQGFTGAGDGSPGGQFRAGYTRMDTHGAARLYFQAEPAGECGKPGEPTGLWGIYERNRETPQTTLIDPGTPPANPGMIRATPDGRRLYYVTFSSCRRWEQASPFGCAEAEPNDANTGGDVYRFDEASGRSTCLTCEASPDAALTAGAREFHAVLVSDDFSHIYFTSERRLLPGEGEAGATNIYALSGGALRLVATEPPLQNPFNTFGSEGGASRLSTDGNVLVFTAIGRHLTADPLAATCPDLSNNGERGNCEELYRYDDRDRSLECLSCKPAATTTVNVGEAGHTNFSEFPYRMSADGSTVVFATQEALVPADVNRTTDLYEWRNGARRLITDGVTQYQGGLASPQIWAIDEHGANVLFSVVSPGLTGYEADNFSNLYDARIGGGFPRPNPPAHCSEESCQGPLQTPPAEEQPASGNESRGNVAEPKPRCRKGTVRRHGRCLKQRHRHRKHHHNRSARHRRTR